MNAAFGVRFAPDFFAFLARFGAFLALLFFAAFLEDFFAAPFLAPFFAPAFFAAMLVSWNNEQVLAMSETLYDGAQDTMLQCARKRAEGRRRRARRAHRSFPGRRVRAALDIRAQPRARRDERRGAARESRRCRSPGRGSAASWQRACDRRSAECRRREASPRA